MATPSIFMKLTSQEIENRGWEKMNMTHPNLKRVAFKKDNFFLVFDTTYEIPWIEIILQDPCQSNYHFPENIKTVLPCPDLNSFITIENLINLIDK